MYAVVTMGMMTICRSRSTVVEMTVASARTRANLPGGVARRWLADGLVALLVGVAQVGGTYAVAVHHSQSITPGGFVLLAAGPAALVWRRRFPVAVLAAAYVVTLWYATSANPGGPIWDALIVAFGTAIYLRKRVAAITFLVLGYVGLLWGPAVAGAHQAPSAVFALGLAAGLIVLLAVSEGIRLRQQRSAALAHGRAEEALRRASEERLRMARDLHDVVAHNIAVINVQASTALHLMDRQPERARMALSAINEVSKQALVELRSVLGVLRQVDEDAPRSPSPTLGHLSELITRAAAAGLAVRVERKGAPVPMPANVELAAFRIVQEALTNAARHSGGSTAVVRIAFGEHEVIVEIDDDGTARTPHRIDGAGNGIVGMKERAQALGGVLEAGPRPDGGFRVRTCLPLGAAAR
jgi:signal transduction histidine kinase